MGAAPGQSREMRRVLGIGDRWAVGCGGEGVGFGVENSLWVYMSRFRLVHWLQVSFQASNNERSQSVALCSLCKSILQWRLLIWIPFTSINPEAW